MTLAAWAAASSSAGWNVAGRSTPARPAASYWKRLAWIGSISSRGPNGSRSEVGRRPVDGDEVLIVGREGDRAVRQRLADLG